MSEAKIEGYFFTAVFVGMFAVVGLMFLPFLGAVAGAVVLATLVHPFHEYLERKTGRPNLSAFFVTVVVMLAVVIPALGLFVLLLQEAQGILTAIQQLDSTVVPNNFGRAYGVIVHAVPLVSSIDMPQVLSSAFQGMGGALAGLVTVTADALFKLVVTMLVLFYMLRDGQTFLHGFIELSPLTDDEDVLIVQKLKAVSLSLIRGTMVVATLQGLLTGVGLFIFGVPNPVLWGSVAAISALIPTIGIAAVTVPASIYLVFTGAWWSLVGFVAWSVLIAGTIDNILGPKLIGGGAKIHPMFILLSVLGGLWLFGVPGFLIGPLLFGLLVALSEIYKVKIKAMHEVSAGL